jgi:hypothetical protein
LTRVTDLLALTLDDAAWDFDVTLVGGAVGLTLSL